VSTGAACISEIHEFASKNSERVVDIVDSAINYNERKRLCDTKQNDRNLLLYKLVDERLYKAKEGGRNRVVFA